MVQPYRPGTARHLQERAADILAGCARAAKPHMWAKQKKDGVRMSKRIFVVFSLSFMALLSLATGCATLPSTEKMALELSGYNLPKQSEPESALIYVVRPSSMGTLIRFNVFVDDKEDSSEMGYTRGSQYLYFFVSPGKHTIFSKAENWAEINIDLKEGETVFLKQNPAMGIIMARNDLELIQEVEGKYHVKNTSIGVIKKDRKNALPSLTENNSAAPL